jgi:hypothetical protein
MKHRHLNMPEGVYTVAAVDSVLERGGASDIYALLAALRADPFGPAAIAAEKAARHSDVYGYPALLLRCLEDWRQEALPAGGPDRRQRMTRHGMICCEPPRPFKELCPALSWSVVRQQLWWRANVDRMMRITRFLICGRASTIC